MPDTNVPLFRQIVAERRFILATRDTGYRGTVAAIAELVDNAIQARAQNVRITLSERGERVRGHWQRHVEISVLDDGIGMDYEQLWSALQFGGSSRFEDREGLGRFGMGLPNSSVSQSRRIEVFSWQSCRAVMSTYLDVDEVAGGRLDSIPRPGPTSLPTDLQDVAAEHGTLVVWHRCDRIDFRKATTLAEKLIAPLGRIYRRPIWQGLRLLVNGVQVNPVDPLFCHPVTGLGGGTLYGTPLHYEFAGTDGRRAVVEVRFTLLPVAKWALLSVEGKRDMGIVGAAGACFLRAGREIDTGWKLFGGKRRENYDDWWRCEVSFPPALDEEFGVTHSKQGVHPRSVVRSALAPDLEAIARVLNAKVRDEFMSLRNAVPSKAVVAASRGDRQLPAGPASRRVRGSAGMRYEFRTAALSSPAFFLAEQLGGKLVITLNTKHPFFNRIYQPLTRTTDLDARFAVELLLLAAARAEFDCCGRGAASVLRQHRAVWSDALVAFLDTCKP